MKSSVLIYTLSIIAAVNFLYIGIISRSNFQGERISANSKTLSNIFTVIAYIGVWYSISIAIVETGIVDFGDNFAGISLLFTGYGGALFYIFTRFLINPTMDNRKSLYLLLLGGIPGSIYAIVFFLLPSDVATQYVTSFREGKTVQMGVLSVLFMIHTTQLFLFLVVSLITMVRALVSTKIKAADKKPIQLFLIAICTGILALTVSNLLPLFFEISFLTKVGPLLLLPTFIITLKSIKLYHEKSINIDSQKKSLGKYLSPTVIENIFSQNDELCLGGEVEEATILFVDIRGFTRMSESRSPEEVVNYLNAYFGRMNTVIFNNYGMIDKFIGDAILVVFGIPGIGRNHRLDALNCAEQMVGEIANFNDEVVIDDYRLSVGIGIHTGELLHGNIGCGERMEYTVIGDAVNTASRLESLTKEYNIPIIFSENTFAYSEYTYHAARYMGQTTIRGKSDRVKVYTIEGMHHQS